MTPIKADENEKMKETDLQRERGKKVPRAFDVIAALDEGTDQRLEGRLEGRSKRWT